MAMMNARYFQGNNLNATVSGTLARLSAVPRAGTKGPDEDNCGRHIITLGHNGDSLDTGTGTDNYHKRLSIAIGSDELTLEFTGENDHDV
ncbi:hypothetical protein SERLA73DRAFT_78556 [Serpula lacrymans var. lacrymans S7.3]|uniref:Uncharacterized protein n=2 Tax=Serpula lacrymans var. lacrymans TaxID=341189 RepID=F8QDM3_SERL3|nr:uncharacterized protein SERLADRAFT_443601 [Serpula lacrymans var. lacrymans S7.9]EGN93694.1 hypothetical protein SERLA73DRAFT_78556 [Serpula lacrymans var. lacrymans S7.3]EGO19064.1 hypothetical protein SERLADRAFT_443601 [Serpula lacrymans var. lacrymans S7.9]